MNYDNPLIELPVSYIAGYNDIVVTAVLASTPSVAVPVLPPVYDTTTHDQVIPASLGWVETDASGVAVTYGVVATHIKIVGASQPVVISVAVNEYVYFTRSSISEDWTPVKATYENMLAYTTGKDTSLWKRHPGRSDLNFAWAHFSPRYQLVDPSPTNIIDIFIITRGYFISFKRWLEDPLATPPDAMTPLSLRNDYSKLLDNKMASDTVILHPGKLKLIFGSKADPSLQAKIKVIRSSNGSMTDNQIKNTIVATVRNFFDIAAFEFGETFFFTELASAIHMDLPAEISSVVLVPTYKTGQFGDLMQLFAREDEIIYPDINVVDIEVVSGFTPTNLRLNG